MNANPTLIRLNKLLASKGLCSRREADRLIAASKIRVNGVVVNAVGVRVDASAALQVHQTATAKLARQQTVLLNKPLGIVSSQAEHGHTPAIQLLTRRNQFHRSSTSSNGRNSRRRELDDEDDQQMEDCSNKNPTSPRQLPGWATAGRLDVNSTGLLVLTQAGRIVQQIIGENTAAIEKEYLVRVHPPLTAANSDAIVTQLLAGIECTGEFLEAGAVDVINENQLRMILTAGRKHHIRRMCRAVDLKVQALKRVRIGQVVLGDLPAGHWRYLRADESFV